MSRKRYAFGYLFVLLALSCSCPQGGSRFGKLTPASPLFVDLLGNTDFPLEVCSLSRTDSTVTARYRFFSEDCLCSAGPVLFFDRSGGWEVTVNGTPMGRSVAVSGVVQEGENVIELRGSGDVPPLSLVGEFNVIRAGDGQGWIVRSAKVPAPGRLAPQGLSFYSGEVCYRRDYELTGDAEKHILRIPAWKGTSCVVQVNGVKVADVTRTRFKMDVGPYLNPGTNMLEIYITGTDGDFGLLKDFSLE